MLPHRVPLYKAFDALLANDLKLAESEIERFFDALEADVIAFDWRGQLFDRQVLEEDFVSAHMIEVLDHHDLEIDAGR